MKPAFNKKGQIIVEYILLVVASTVIALTLMNLVSVVSSDPSEKSPVFKYWENLLKHVGEDIST